MAAARVLHKLSNYLIAVYERKIKFLTELQHSENTTYRRCEKNIVDELATVYGYLCKEWRRLVLFSEVSSVICKVFWQLLGRYDHISFCIS